MCSLCTCPAIPISNRPPVHPAATPRFESRRCDLCHSQGEDKPGSPAISKWQLRLGWGLKPYRGGAGTAGGAGLKSETLFSRSPSGFQGAQPRHAFGSFRRETKGTPGVGRVGPLMGRSEEPSLTTCSRRGAAPPRIGGCRDYVLAEIPGPCTHKPRPSPIYMAKKPFLRREPV